MKESIKNWLLLASEFGEDIVLSSKDIQLKDLSSADPTFARPAAANAAPASNHLNNLTLEQLRQAVQSFDGCILKKSALNTVFSDGDPSSKVMFIGEAPGAEEDKQGRPFVGQSGQLLNKMLNAIGLSRSEVYITNVVYWRPPGNRTPDPEEISLCMPFLERHIEIISPKVIVLLGATAMRAVLQITSGLSRARGIWHEYMTPSGQKFKTMVTFHPSYLLRSPGQKMLAWQDFIMLSKELNHG